MHAIYKVTDVEVLPPYGLRVTFDDGIVREVDLQDMLAGELYGPLRDAELFHEVSVDPEAHTVTWPNGADFDPETLHDWPEHRDALVALARSWRSAAAH